MRLCRIILLAAAASAPAIAQSALPKSTSWKVVLTCAPPASSPDPVAGYEFFRAPLGSSSYALLNAAPVTTCSYSDLTPPPGATSDYVAESVDANGVTSIQSNTAAVAVSAVPTAPAVSSFAVF